MCVWSHADSATTSTIKALLDRFTRYTAGDASAIPADLLNITFSTVSSYQPTPSKANIPPNYITTLGREARRRTGVRRGAQIVRKSPNPIDQGSSYVRSLYLPARAAGRIWLITTHLPVAV